MARMRELSGQGRCPREVRKQPAREVEHEPESLPTMSGPGLAACPPPGMGLP